MAQDLAGELFVDVGGLDGNIMGSVLDLARVFFHEEHISLVPSQDIFGV